MIEGVPENGQTKAFNLKIVTQNFSKGTLGKTEKTRFLINAIIKTNPVKKCDRVSWLFIQTTEKHE